MSRRVWWVVGMAGMGIAVVVGTVMARDLIRGMEVTRTMSGAMSLAAGVEGHMGELLEAVASLQWIEGRPECLEPTEYDAATALLRKAGMLDNPNKGSEVFRDAWGQGYQVWVVRNAGDPRPHVQEVRSAGPDRQFGTEDDVVAGKGRE